MASESEVIATLVEWAAGRPQIRSLLLTGSRATEEGSDEFSDYDVAVFAEQTAVFTSNEDWLAEVGTPWVCVHEMMGWKERTIPTRLVIFDPGIKIDFAFYPCQAMEQLASSKLPDEFAAGYRVLLDKDGLASAVPPPSEGSYRQEPPSQGEFSRIIEEFWFEIYHVAKYLVRGDLWSAKFRDHGLKQEFLLQMIRWNAQAQHNWEYATHAQGKCMKEWVDPELWQHLQQCFSHFEEEDSWRALDQTIALFRRISQETAGLLGFSYPKDLDHHISGFVRELRRDWRGQGA